MIVVVIGKFPKVWEIAFYPVTQQIFTAETPRTQRSIELSVNLCCASSP
jgi:hypothetical protein